MTLPPDPRLLLVRLSALGDVLFALQRRNERRYELCFTNRHAPSTRQLSTSSARAK
jgi:hypothetical protein